MAKKNKILITGAFGFIGSHLTEFLIEKGDYDDTLIPFIL